MLPKYILYIINVIFLIFSIGACMWGILISYINLIIIIYTIFLLYKSDKISKSIVALIINVFVFIAVTPISNIQYERKSDVYFKQIRNGQDLTFVEKINVFNLNILIGVVAYPFYPEIAKETLCMIFPDKDRIKSFESDFFMQSPKIIEAFDKNVKHVSWPPGAYLNPKESKVALALNPCELSKKQINGSSIYYATTKASYPYQSKTLLVTFPMKFYVQEGLFHYLQKVGWLHTYKAIWYCEN